MTRTRILLAAAVVLALALAGCSGSDEKPTAASTSGSPSDDRAICRDSVQPGAEPDLDVTRNQKLAARAALSANPGLAAAGQKLAAAAGGAAMTGGEPSDRVAIAEAQRDLAVACKNLFGPGPWT